MDMLSGQVDVICKLFGDFVTYFHKRNLQLEILGWLRYFTVYSHSRKSQYNQNEKRKSGILRRWVQAEDFNKC